MKHVSFHPLKYNSTETAQENGENQGGRERVHSGVKRELGIQSEGSLISSHLE